MENQAKSLPQRAQDAAEFVSLMRQLKERSGLTYRQLEERAAVRGDVLPRSTLANVLAGRTPPRPELLAAFVRACGDGHRLEAWLAAWADIGASKTVSTAEPEPVRRPPLRGLIARRPVAVAAGVMLALLLTGAGVRLLAAPGGEPAVSGAAGGNAGPALPAVSLDLPEGWVRIRPVSAPELCLTDGRVRDRRYTPLVAVQRPCDQVAPQDTLLEPVGGDSYRIQWHHPDYGKGCLKVLTQGSGAGLLEPMDDCAQGSRFHIEPSGPPGNGTYVFRVDGQGCMGIVDSGTREGTEAVMDRCVGRDGQVFVIEPAR
ncbi:helix-turn-helix transcriptional regulator [Streptomyces sp. NPDC050856]|uniref:helix-turn-helix transcriptional regulator n=1 Tax=Streptomyces sp. NPDC050856 TaxID=3154939 RepID=UPI0033CF57C2